MSIELPHPQLIFRAATIAGLLSLPGSPAFAQVPNAPTFGPQPTSTPRAVPTLGATREATQTPTPTRTPIPTLNPNIPPTRTVTPTPITNEVCGDATFYHPSLQGERMANNQPYDRFNPRIAAFNSTPLGTEIMVTTRTNPPQTERFIVSDRGLMPNSDVDLSEAGFQRFRPLGTGRFSVCVRW